MCMWDPTNRKLTIPGLTIVNPGEQPEAKMGLEDFGLRSTTWIRQITIHTTGGHWPQTVRPGAGPGGHAREVSKYWKNDPHYGGAPFVIDTNGVVWLLIDPFKYMVWHATTVNPWSIGIEMCTLPDGSIYQATLDACVKLVKGLCELCGIPFQTTSRVYKENTIIERLRDGGKYVVGVFGHRDNAWIETWQLPPEKRAQWPKGYANRGQGDPGNQIFTMLKAAGAMAFDYDALGDIKFWKPIQQLMNRKYKGQIGYRVLDEDGVYGPGMHAMMKRNGLWQPYGVFAEAPLS